MLEVLDLEGNHVEDLGACSYLAWCGSLHHLTLAGNPVAEEENYHSEVGSSWSCPESEQSSQRCPRLHLCGPAASMDWRFGLSCMLQHLRCPAPSETARPVGIALALRTPCCCAADCSSLAPPGGSRRAPAAGAA